jgi:hypothetical protein
LATEEVFKDNEHYYIMTLSFGEARPEPINSIRVPYQERAYCSDPLHPIVRRYKKMEKVA